MTLRPEERLTVHQAMRHPWVRGIEMMDRALPPRKPRLQVSLQGLSSEEKENSSERGELMRPVVRASSRKQRKQREGDDSTRSSALITPKPHIGTVPLFLVKKPSLRTATPLSPEVHPPLQKPALEKEEEEGQVGSWISTASTELHQALLRPLDEVEDAPIEDAIESYSSGDEHKIPSTAGSATTKQRRRSRSQQATDDKQNMNDLSRKPSHVSLFQMMKINSAKTSHPPSATSTDEVVDLCLSQETQAAGKSLASGASTTEKEKEKETITQYFKPTTKRRAEIAATAGVLLHNSAAADEDHVPVKRQKSLMEVWSKGDATLEKRPFPLTSETTSDENKCLTALPLGPSIKSYTSPNACEVRPICSPKSGDFHGAVKASPASSTKKKVQFGSDLKKLREPMKHLSDLYKR